MVLERENPTIPNAALRPLALRTIGWCRATLEDFGLVKSLAHVYLTPNDGTVCSLEEVFEYPINHTDTNPLSYSICF